VGKRAGLKHFTPHDLRRTYISTALDSMVDLSLVRDLAGHASVETTVLYDLRGEQRKREAIERIAKNLRGDPS
jgi:integrase